MIRTAGVYLLFGAVTLRALVVFTDDPQLPLVMVLLFAYGIFLVTGPRLIRQKRAGLISVTPSKTGEKPPANQVFLPLAYLLLQSSLIVALLFIPATEDFFGNLFILLGMDAVLCFGRRTGFLAIAIFSLTIAVALAGSAQGLAFGLVMAFLYGGVGFMFGSYAHQVQKAEAARRENQRLMTELHAAHQQLQGYVTQAEDIAAEHERSRLARELHDSVTQTVFSMNLTVQGASLLLAREPGRVPQQLERLEELASGALNEIRALVFQLRTASEAPEGSGAVAAQSLPVALHQLAAGRLAQDGLKVSIEVNGQRSLAPLAAIGLYAIAQEALHNAARHAGTGRAFVRLNLADGGACLEIEDHGPGFEPTTALAEPGHFGLAGMADRAREIGWTLTVDSGLGRGTRIRVVEHQKEREVEHLLQA